VRRTNKGYGIDDLRHLATYPPPPGDGWQDDTNDCQTIGQEYICPSGGGVGSNLPDFDLALECL
jgi:hypothetical protein